jgi:hypothetical protein
MMNPYHRAVRRWLRNEYGVSPKVQYGTNHPYLTFDYGGRARRVTLHNDSRETNVLAMKKRDIRRELGTPPERTTPPQRRMEDMMPELAHDVGHHVEVTAVSIPSNDKPNAKVALYHGEGDKGYRVKIMIRDDAVVKKFGGTLSTQRLDDETWVVRPSTTARAKFRREGKEWQTVTAMMPGEHALFGASPAEAVEIDGTITVHCPIATRVKLGAPFVQPKPLLYDEAEVMEKLRVALTPRQPDPDFPTPDHMRRTLALIVEIERLGVFRLIKVNGAWRFRAPDISLEDEG